MGAVRAVVDFVMHLDRHLAGIIHQYGVWTYAILVAIVFGETGLVVLPLLPGDSLLFAAGSFAAIGSLNPWVIFLSLSAAAILGDNVNYWIGRGIGQRAYTHDYRWIRRAHLDRTHQFFERFGPRTIIMARFIPIVRTFTPFVAGVGAMTYPRFLAYDVVGGVAWVGMFSWAGYWFGNLPKVRENFSLVMLGIIVVSIAPMLIEFLRARRHRRSRGPGQETA